MKLKFAVDLIFPPRCMFCAEVLPSGEKCTVCKENVKRFKMSRLDINYSIFKRLDKCIAFYYYEDLIREGLHYAKYKSCDGFKREFLEYTEFDFEKFFVENGIDTVISMPFHKTKLYEEEYDLPREMAGIIAKSGKIEYNESLVIKVKKTKNQHDLNRSERKNNIKDAFRLNGDVAGKSIAVMDDIVTTGYSMEEIAKVLKRGGAKKVIGIAFAYNR